MPQHWVPAVFMRGGISSLSMAAVIGPPDTGRRRRRLHLRPGGDGATGGRPRGQLRQPFVGRGAVRGRPEALPAGRRAGTGPGPQHQHRRAHPRPLRRFRRLRRDPGRHGHPRRGRDRGADPPRLPRPRRRPTGRLLPTGNPVDEVELDGAGRFRLSLVDAANPHIAALCPPRPFRTLDGRLGPPPTHDVGVPMLSMERAHRAVPVTGALCLAVACRVPGTVARALAAAPAGGGNPVRVGNPSGVVQVAAPAG
jgi:hypothetical protein